MFLLFLQSKKNHKHETIFLNEMYFMRLKIEIIFNNIKSKKLKSFLDHQDNREKN